MPRIPQNLRERAIGMLNADMVMNVVAMNIGCSSHAIRDIRLHFQAKARTKDRPRSGRPRVTTRGQDRYIRNTCVIASKLPQVLLLIAMVHITTVYLHKL